MAKSSGAQRESEGVVVVRIGAQNNAPGAKGPCFDRVCDGGKR
jgi:RNA-directed DNA polymerase